MKAAVPKKAQEVLMNLSATTFILVSALLLASCVPSLHPLYTDADLITDREIVGTWVDNETGETWTLSNGGHTKYTLVHTDADGRKGEFTARLVKLEDKLFLDIVPVASSVLQNDFYRDRFIATHTFLHVQKNASTVAISYLEPRWLKDHVAENPNSIRHEKIAGEIVLTSSPKDTQKFLLAHLNTREAFSQPAELVRKRGGQ
jgi:hypothetical protein